ncbi:MAG: hypothetical protein Q8K02_00790 [Flavobacterium sp.]|nr:hypothetical protein [Flavobacterium sp.]
MKKTIFFNPSYLLSYSCCRSDLNDNSLNLFKRISFKSNIFLLFAFLFIITSQSLYAQDATLEDSNLVVKSPRNLPVNSIDLVLEDGQIPLVTTPACNKTYIYNVCWGTPALSHYVLGLPTCFTANDIEAVFVNGTPYNIWTVGNDPTCGVYGLKWDNLNLGGNTCADFKVVFKTEYVPGNTLGYSKAGTNCTSTSVVGPTCTPCNNCPDECSISGPSLVCPGSTGNIYSAPQGQGYQYTWSISGTGSSIVGPNNQQTVSVKASLSCNNSYVLTLTLQTAPGCIKTCSYQVVIKDNENPIVVSGPQDFILECGLPVPPPGEIVATDNCGNVFVQFLGDFVYPGDCPGVYLLQRTWKVSDQCTNHVYHKQLITIQDSTPPTISGVGASFSVECSDKYAFSNPTSLDGCDANPSLTYTDTPNLDACGLGTITRTWTSVDCSGNSSTASQTVTIIDSTNPVIVSIADYSLQGCNTDWPTLTTTWTDNCSTGGSLTATAGDISTNGCLQSRVYTFTVADCAGNSSTSTTTVTRTYDVTAPSIAAIADYALQGCNMEWPTLTTTWTDNCSEGGSLTATAGDVSTNGCLQSRVYTFTVTDDCGNTSSSSTTVTRTYDVTAPSIVAIADYTLQGCNMEWPTLTTKWTDNCSAGGSLTATA